MCNSMNYFHSAYYSKIIKNKFSGIFGTGLLECWRFENLTFVALHWSSLFIVFMTIVLIFQLQYCEHFHHDCMCVLID